MAAQATKFDNAVTMAGTLTVTGATTQTGNFAVTGTVTGIETGTASVDLAADGFGSLNLTYTKTYASAPKPFFTVNGAVEDSVLSTQANSLTTTGCRLNAHSPASASGSILVSYAIIG